MSKQATKSYEVTIKIKIQGEKPCYETVIIEAKNPRAAILYAGFYQLDSFFTESCGTYYTVKSVKPFIEEEQNDYPQTPNS